MRYSLFLAAFLLLRGCAWAHELEIGVWLSSPAVLLRTTYAGADPVAHAQVQVFSPATGEGAGAAYQTGRTDRRGRFSFVPDVPGLWRVVVDDEEGHKRETTVAVPAGFPASGEGAVPVATSEQSSRMERVLLGLAILFGVTGVAYGLKARGRGAA